MADGALIESLAVGFHGVTLAQLKPGCRVLVMGPIDLAAAFWSRRVGAGRIAVASRSPRSEGIARQMGASAVVQFGAEFEHDLEQALLGALDVVFECIGLPAMLMQAAGLVRPRGTVMIFGQLHVA